MIRDQDGAPRRETLARSGRTITIDGPVASGKSTLGEALARRLGYTYVDSGALYRAVTLLALRRSVDVRDGAALAAVARAARLEVTRPAVADGRQYTVLLDGEDVTWALRSPDVERDVSAVSAQAGVRQAVNEQLRRMIAPGGTVVVGRDIGNVVLPDAFLKIYLTAGPEARARRRAAELAARGLPADYELILENLQRRDAYDGERAVAPMRPAPDAIHLATDDVDVEQEVEAVLQHLGAKERPAGG
ncbi:MAG: (d)CMP kinase [Chloroflexota bacterium]|nr:(d)CMP kinase [Chloroflexota bacterium]